MYNHSYDPLVISQLALMGSLGFLAWPFLQVWIVFLPLLGLKMRVHFHRMHVLQKNGINDTVEFGFIAT